jgi:rod shape-determining protein MreC
VLAFLKQYRDLAITVALLAVPFFVYLVYAKQGRDLNMVDRAILQGTGPIERYLTSAIEWGEDRWGDYVALRDVRAQNMKLREELMQLKADTVQLDELRQENERLRTALDFGRQVPPANILAQVVALGGTNLFLSLTIGRGERDGIRKNMAVVTPQGVVGKVETVGPTYAQVQLITDVNSNVAVESQRTRARATVKGTGENRICKLQLAERAAQFEEGDMLITSGTDGVFPKGLAVGRVSNIERKGKNYSLTAEVIPAVPLGTIEEVMVVPSPVTREVMAASPPAIDPALLKAAHP